MAECLPQQDAQRASDDDGSSIHVEDISTVNGEHSPGFLFVSQLSKQKPRVHHTASTKAPTKHNLDAPDLSDFTFAPANQAPHHASKTTQYEFSSFSPPACGIDDASQSHQGNGEIPPSATSSRDKYVHGGCC